MGVGCGYPVGWEWSQRESDNGVSYFPVERALRRVKYPYAKDGDSCCLQRESEQPLSEVRERERERG